ncbi:hypothetical protein A3A71_02050 [Candidatus Berkelbacteria bacterium RIFCSPLOWO2_01_FULL_50_28]|uniref:NGG1p interacting factor NIF3 n=1 Tax=Candidatus Berkelbacteria bacterium RIFCSPLOWO2_01_FULL_50_28 TaxID=1797471 RepID=A0A1F5EC11_9BACT|nr:MAG: hypothetical protein A2807_00445 [Candidatus Berkelbacteria bacterium RIFCSPHIGHO2_01_FULL_50_36]OGD63220.1 MAG: hypothetical protein A3F39_02315 [Candidatus Berkelbacteria bacterium RIFCSPHIGHO2_12_FULL_50_11]OGD64806.1 MAG: hypothetical protein A3A71_02050 [Candidatus Berkelbacteria bacterium RIFCSPLOWO2_01_FULL_50_28]
MKGQKVKLVVFVPPTHVEAVLRAMGDAGAGKIGNYDYCTYSSVGVGRFLPKEGANPTVGQVGKLEEVEEIKIETICEKNLITKVIEAVKKVHPYEEAPFDVYLLLEVTKL